MLVSAVIADGPPRRVIEVLAEGAAELVLPAPVPIELARVLSVKLGLEAGTIAAIIRLVEEVAGVIAEVPPEIEAVSGDADDDRILAAAVMEGANLLVSGDSRHLLPLGSYRSMRSLKPQAFLALLG